eukprot:49990-Eustigmatos_ZCMA.PRE.1
MLRDWSGVDRERVISYIRSCRVSHIVLILTGTSRAQSVANLTEYLRCALCKQSYDGGIALIPGQESDGEG